MNLFSQILLLTIFCFTRLVAEEEPMLVKAVVRELTIDPYSPPLANGNASQTQSSFWNVKLEILQVLRGDPTIKGKEVSTATADTEINGNGRYVIPKLNEGDVGIWAIKSAADGSWTQVYAPYEVEKGIQSPLIKGRHDQYEATLTR